MFKFLFALFAIVGFSSAQFMNVTEASGSAEYGVDVSSAISSTVASCLVSGGKTFVVPRGYRSSGSVDTNVCTSLKNAQNAGVKRRDVYLFPCELLFFIIAVEYFLFILHTFLHPRPNLLQKCFCSNERINYWII